MNCPPQSVTAWICYRPTSPTGLVRRWAAECARRPVGLNMLDQGRADGAVEAAADCLERCPVPNPPTPASLQPGGYDLVVSDFVLTQLYSLPLLDVVDTLTAYAPAIADLRETLPRYQDAANSFRRRVALAHLALLRDLLAPDGVALLLSDRAGELLPPKTGPHPAIPLSGWRHCRRARWRFPATWNATIRLPRQYGRGAG